MPVAWGILSTAKINEKFLQGVRESSEVQVVAVASRNRESAEHYAREHDIDRAHEGYEALLADPEVETVYIPLPNSMHVEWSIRALEAGKHVLCEKPLSRRADEVARAFEVAEQNQRLLSEGFMYRHHPQTRRLAELVKDGAIGELRLVRAAFSFPLPAPENVRLKAELDGGALMDVGCYCVSGARLLAGEPESVTAQQTLGGDGVDIGFAATMKCANDVLVHLDAGMSFAARDELEVVGTDGSLFLDDPWHCVNPVIELRRDGGTERIEIERANPYRLEAENLSAAINHEQPLLLGREDALGQARCIEALYEAADQSAGRSRLTDRLLYLHHDSSWEHDPRVLSPDHPDTPRRIEAIEAALGATGWRGLERRRAPPATEGELALVHSLEHIRFIQQVAACGGGRIDDDTIVGPVSYEAALHAAGGACELARTLLTRGGAGFSALRPAGHHAKRDRSMGFCLFNNVAVAAALAVAELGARRVMIIDWDVHHGNGTEDIFRRRSDVLYASIHQAGLFPGTGETADLGSAEGRGYTINVPVPKGSAEEVWISVLEYVIVPVLLEYRPDLVLISAGFDAHRDDPLGGCLLDSTSFGQMTCLVRDAAASIGAPVGSVLEGGYHPPALAESVDKMLAALRGEGEAESIAPDPLITARAAAHVGHYWTL